MLVDGARFLPHNVTITKVVCTIYSKDKVQLIMPFESVALPESEMLNPRFGSHTILAQGTEKFDDATATLVMQVQTIDR